MRTVLSLLLLALLSIAAEAQQVQRIEITEAGIYKAETGNRTAAPGTPGGSVVSLSGIKLVQKTTTIPAAVATRFGIRYKIIGQPNGTSVNLKMVTRYPSPGVRNPTTGNTIMRGEYSAQKKLGTESYRDYGLDEGWELVPGKWTFEIWQDDRKLAEQSFTLVKP